MKNEITCNIEPKPSASPTPLQGGQLLFVGGDLCMIFENTDNWKQDFTVGSLKDGVVVAFFEDIEELYESNLFEAFGKNYNLVEAKSVNIEVEVSL